MIARFRFVSALRGKLRRFSCCSVLGPPRSSGQVSKATHGVIAMRAPSGHLIGCLFGLTFILPPAEKFLYSCHSSKGFPNRVTCARRFRLTSDKIAVAA